MQPSRCVALCLADWDMAECRSKRTPPPPLLLWVHQLLLSTCAHPHHPQADQARQATVRSNPFGNAKPREAVLSERLGKPEEEIIKEAAKHEKPKLRLNSQQLEEKLAAEVSESGSSLPLRLAWMPEGWPLGWPSGGCWERHLHSSAVTQTGC